MIMKPGSFVAYPFATISLILACSAESRPFDNIKSFNILSEQSPLRDYIMGSPSDQVSTSVIISDVLGKTQNIAIFSGLTRDIDTVSGRLDNAAQNATVLAPDNSVMRELKRKPWEDPEDYNTFGTSAYEGSSGEDRARGNLERFVQRHIIPESPWEEGKKVKTLSGNEIWWETKDGQKKVSPPSYRYFGSVFVPLVPQAHTGPISSLRVLPYTNIMVLAAQFLIKQPINPVRWPSWLWRQVKVILTLLPGHESGAGSSPVLISIRLALSDTPGSFFLSSSWLGGAGEGLFFGPTLS
jgi:hypothetical protein